MAVTSRPIIALPVGGRLLRPDPPAPPPSCTITLEAPGVGALFGAQALNVSGQTASITIPSQTTDSYSASTTPEFTIDWTGRRAIEFACASTDFARVGRGVISTSGGPVISAWYWRGSAGGWETLYNDAAQVQVAGAATDNVAIVVNANGDIEFWKDGVLHDTDTTSFSAGTVARLFTAGNANNATIPAGASMSTEFKTTSYSGNFNSADDWCGNAI